MWWTWEKILENGLCDPNFPYPLAFTSAMNMWEFLILLLFFLIVLLMFKMVLRWLMSSVG